MKTMMLFNLVVISLGLFPILSFGQEQERSPEIIWSNRTIPNGQEIRGLVYDKVTDELLVGSTFGVGASVHHVSPTDGETLLTVTLEKSPDDVGDDPPHFIGPFSTHFSSEDGSIDYVLMVINDGFDADGAGIGRIAKYSPSQQEFLWTVNTMGMNPNDTRGYTGYAQDVPSISNDGLTAYICQADGTLSAIDTISGEYIWQIVDDGRRTMQGVSVLGDYDLLYVSSGSLDFVGSPGLHVYSAVDGSYFQSYNDFSGDGPKIRPLATDIAIYVTDNEEGLHQFYPNSVVTGSNWNTLVSSSSSSQQVFENPVVTGDGTTLYAPASNTLGRVSANDGSVIWRKSLGGTFNQALILSSGSSFVYTANRIPLEQGDGGDVRKVSTESGDVIWKFRSLGGFSQEIGGALNLNDDESILYFATYGGTIFAVQTELPETDLPTTTSPSGSPTISSTTTSPSISTATTSPTSLPTTMVPSASPTDKPTEPPSSESSSSKVMLLSSMMSLSMTYVLVICFL